jgi:hypothetical protein
MYLYIFEDGEMKQSPMGPTDIDSEMIEGGYLVVVQLKMDGGFHQINQDGTLKLIDSAIIETEKNGVSYHQ